MHNDTCEKNIDFKRINHYFDMLNTKSIIRKAVDNNNIRNLEKIIKKEKISDFYPLFLYALIHERVNIVKYLLENKKEYLDNVYEASSTILMAASNMSSKCLPLLLSYDFNPIAGEEENIVTEKMQACAPSADCIYKLFKMMLLLAEAAVNVEASSINIFEKKDAEQKIDKALKDISKDVLLYHLGSYYTDLFSSTSFSERKYNEIMQIINAFSIFNWIIGAVNYNDIYLVDEPILPQTMHCHQRLHLVKPDGEVGILGWREAMHALKSMSALIYILETSCKDDIRDSIVKHNNDHMHLDSNTVEKLINFDKNMSVNCLKERERALRWLCGFHEKYIQC